MPKAFEIANTCEDNKDSELSLGDGHQLGHGWATLTRALSFSTRLRSLGSQSCSH
jgi:hypothetical protein